MATAYAYLPTQYSFQQLTAGVREFGEFEPPRQLVSICWLWHGQTH